MSIQEAGPLEEEEEISENTDRMTARVGERCSRENRLDLIQLLSVQSQHQSSAQASFPQPQQSLKEPSFKCTVLRVCLSKGLNYIVCAEADNIQEFKRYLGSMRSSKLS